MVDLVEEELLRDIEHYVEANLVDLKDLLRLAEAEKHHKNEVAVLLMRVMEKIRSLTNRLSQEAQLMQ